MLKLKKQLRKSRNCVRMMMTALKEGAVAVVAVV